MNARLRLLITISFILPFLIQADESSEPKAREVMEAHMSNVILFKEGSAFTQKIAGERNIPYELKDFEYIGPRELPLTKFEKNKGLERKLLFSIKTSAWRTYNTNDGWSEWRPGRPLLLGGITLHQRSGKWKVVASPATYYTAK